MTDLFAYLAAASAAGNSPSRLRKNLIPLLENMKSQGGLDPAARAMASAIGIDHFLPPQYEKFRPVLLDSLIFILSELPLKRLAEKIVEQAILPRNASPGERLCLLIKDMPTMQKLGQVVARSPGIEPAFKTALVDLEDNLHTIAYHSIQHKLRRELSKTEAGKAVITEKRILAEASVCAVIPCVAFRENEKQGVPAVLKVIKPAVQRNMRADMALWDRLIVFLDANKVSWGLRDFNFTATFNQVRWLIQNETDLQAEQSNLSFARRYYRSEPALTIPKLLPSATPRMTVMTREEGTKITCVDYLTPQQKRQLAELLTRTCILKPLQDLSEVSVFHGDPHAGNIAYSFRDGRPEIIFYDWAMMGRLTRMERFSMAMLTFGIVVGKPGIVYHAADIITKGQLSKDNAVSGRVTDFIQALVEDRKMGARGIFATIEELFEELTYEGITFSDNLMMFEKAMVTLKGVINDIDPDFDKNDYLAWTALLKFVNDLVSMRFHRVLLEEIWSFYRSNIAALIEIQKTVFYILLKLGLTGLQLPLKSLRGQR